MSLRALLPVALFLATTPVLAQHEAPKPPAKAEPAHASKPVVDPKLAEVKPVSPKSDATAKKIPTKGRAAATQPNDEELNTVVARINQRLLAEEARRKRARAARAKGVSRPEASATATAAPPKRVELTWRVPLSWPEFESSAAQGVDSQVITAR